MGGQVTEAGQVGKCGTGLWNSLVVDILKAGMGLPLRIRSLQTIVQKAYIIYSGIMDGFFSTQLYLRACIIVDIYKLRA